MTAKDINAEVTKSNETSKIKKIICQRQACEAGDRAQERADLPPAGPWSGTPKSSKGSFVPAKTSWDTYHRVPSCAASVKQ